jgi:hypothetical protein
MNLYIRLKNGQPFEHPMFENNVSQAFPSVDLNSLPDWMAKFTRIEQPQTGPYEVYEGVTYQWVDGVVTDVHAVRAMTDVEKTLKQDAVKAQWAVSPNWASWTFNENTCQYDPPTPKPTDGKFYRWDEATTTWVEITL